MKRSCCLGLLLATAGAATCGAQPANRAKPNPEPSSVTRLVNLEGLWQSDLANADAQKHARIYLEQGRELQLKWCGSAWPESEIDRRLSVISTAVVQWLMTVTGGGKALLRTVSSQGKPSAMTVLTACEPAPDSMLKCKVLCPETEKECRPGSEYLRLDGQRLYVFAALRKSQMQCAGASSGPDEVRFVSPIYLEKVAGAR